MTTDTAHRFWNAHWTAPDAKWLTPEPAMLDWAATLAPGSAVLDLGAGVGRHALALAAQGFRTSALDAAPEGLDRLRRTAAELGLSVETVEAPMTALPFPDAAFDHVISWNVIYHGDEDILLRTIAEIRRVLKPGGTYLGTMLSRRRLSHERARATGGREISRNAWVFDEVEGSDKHHPHYFCTAAELVALFQGFETIRLEDRSHGAEGGNHWLVLMERL